MSESPEKKWQRPMLRIHTRAEMERIFAESRPCDPAHPNPPSCLKDDSVPFGPAPGKN
jgi:hypothetical protein